MSNPYQSPTPSATAAPPADQQAWPWMLAAVLQTQISVALLLVASFFGLGGPYWVATTSAIGAGLFFIGAMASFITAFTQRNHDPSSPGDA